MTERGGLWGAEGRVTPVDNILEVAARNLGGGDVEAENLKGKIWEGQILPALPVGGLWDVLGDEETAVRGESLEYYLLKGELMRP